MSGLGREEVQEMFVSLRREIGLGSSGYYERKELESAFNELHTRAERAESELVNLRAERDGLAKALDGLRLHRPELQKHPHTKRGYVAIMTPKLHPMEAGEYDSDSRQWVRIGDVRAALSPGASDGGGVS